MVNINVALLSPLVFIFIFEGGGGRQDTEFTGADLAGLSSVTEL